MRAALEDDADLESRDAQGRTALLLDSGVNPELADGDGVTPLMHARQRGYTHIETLLRQAGVQR